MALAKKVVIALWKIIAGGFFCQFAITSFLVVGWTYRAMQRLALRRWQIRASPPQDPTVLETSQAHWPNWVVGTAPKPGRSGEGRAGSWHGPLRVTFGSLWANGTIGLRAMVNTWALTLFPATLWTVGWYAGWDNSFNKGYEQYYAGIALSWTGILLFLLVMLYLPLAQARHAINGDWRAFYDVRVVCSLIVRSPMRALLLAIAYTIVSFPLLVFLALPVFFEQVFPKTSTMSDAELLTFLNRYYFRVAIVGFGSFVLLHLLAARFYSDILFECVQSGRWGFRELAGVERAILRDVKEQTPSGSGNRALTLAKTTVRPGWRATVLAATLIVWFTFVSQIYVREFLVYHPVRGFMNQPLVQLPWFRYVPDELERAAQRSAEKLAR